jgi:glycosyltransferase involved in cell wall biosynthesis
MKVQLLARPDHSLFLYQYLKKVIDIRMINFNVAKKGSLLHQIHPSAKLVDEDVMILYDFILFQQIIFRLGKLGLHNPYKWESRYAELSYGLRARKYAPDLIHYWPIYCHQYVRDQRKRRNIVTVADVYSAHPYYALETLQSEYDKFNLSIKDSYVYKTAKRDTNFLEHENNIITCSNYIKDSFLKFAPKSKIHIAEYGFLGDSNVIDSYNHVLSSHKVQSQTLKLVYVGTVSIEKGVHYLLKAVKSLNSDRIQLDVIGSVKKGQEKIFQTYRAVKGINFLGYKSNMEIKRGLHKYSALVQPSLSDAYSLAVIEGLQNALPVIVSSETGIKDSVEKYKVGEVVDTADAASLAAAIERFMNPEYRRSLSENIKVFIEDDTRNPYPMKVLDIYRKILLEHGS